MSISPQRGKENRPFVGVIALVNGAEFCIPLTSPKDKFKTKKSQLDFIKIFDESRVPAVRREIFGGETFEIQKLFVVLFQYRAADA